MEFTCLLAWQPLSLMFLPSPLGLRFWWRGIGVLG
nr:MAG TPA: hypothetical protein [Caudoviricetes sp.]